jgi:hypothetical protein
MTVIFTPNHFQLCKKVTWDDVILKLSNEIENNTYGITVVNNNKFPSIRLPNQFQPDSIIEAFNEVKREKDVKILHVYLSFSGECGTFGRHKDSCDVFIVQSIGEVSYRFDDGSTYKLTPGDSIYIMTPSYILLVLH